MLTVRGPGDGSALADISSVMPVIDQHLANAEIALFFALTIALVLGVWVLIK